MDFTIIKYRSLLNALLKCNYNFQTFNEYINNPAPRTILLRHDVDARPQNSLNFARIQSELSVSGVYYFRAVPQSWDVKVIREIFQLGHEVGLHYETMDMANGNIDQAWELFKHHLSELRKIVPVTTICMHGSPLSKFDNRSIWNKFDYKSLGLIGEPYFDIDFDQVLYLTDTGRKWDGNKVSVRDKVNSNFEHSFHSTNDIIMALENCELPDQMMFNFHPQRWNDNYFIWTKELITQNLKNLIKRYFFIANK